jgi:light-regulated signal transduction histidine kinase (bacteriophytochrome)
VALTVGREEPLGLLAVLYANHRPPQAQVAPVLRLLASRAAAELERLQHVAAIERLNAELERRVADRTAQLLASNTEFEAFSYSVSHDLRAPLRAIAGFSRALEEDYGANLDETARDYLRRIQSGSKRMGDLIDDLLNLARISRSDLRLRPVDLSKLARKIGAEAAAQSGRAIDFVVTPGLSARADPDLLRVALTNLIDNAWKYTRQTAAPRVEFTRLPVPDADGATVFLVRDNGAGFDMRYASKLFGAFQRLHHVDDFEGTGIGLATVRRILHRHGGRIWAEAAPGEGARFYFTLHRGPASA